jgi:hypothetical protein
MTEAEWVACEDPGLLLKQLKGQVSDRKLRLFAVACCRAVWRQLGESGRRAVEVAEGFCDGILGVAELEQIRDEAHRAMPPAFQDRAGWFHWAAAMTVDEPAFFVAFQVDSQLDGCAIPETAQMVRTEGFLRDIFGNPFRPVAFAPQWRTAAAVALASQMYESREFANMPILADALEDAGCDNDDIIAHCRDPKATHVRGCWVVDLVLGKE